METRRPLTHSLPLRLGLELKAIMAGGLRVLDRIDAARGDVFNAPPRLRTRDWIAVAYRTIVPRECAIDRTPAVLESNLFDMDAKYADVVPLEEVLAYIDTLPVQVPVGAAGGPS